jgi:hypothetical protein
MKAPNWLASPLRWGVILLAISCVFAAGRKPFSLRISAPPSAAKSGAEVNIQIVLTNISKHPINVSETSTGCEFGLEVRDSRGKLALMTEQGRYADDCYHGRGMRITGRNFIMTLKPGESTDDTLNISELREMARPGRYRVKVYRTIPKEMAADGGVVSSNGIVVQVEE